MPRMNDNGLTFDDWLAAAGRSQSDNHTPIAWVEFICAWEGGEDPCEWKCDSHG